MIEAVAYLRTSSLTNVGDDKDSDKRQREAIATYAARAGIEIVEEFYDAEIEKRQKSIAMARGFELQDHALALYAACTKKNCEFRNK